MTELLSPIEAFHNGFYSFLVALRVLAKAAEAQCEAMGDFNVAWELQYDVCAGEYLARNNYGQLSASETAAIIALTQNLKGLPASVLPAASGRTLNLQAMRHGAWQPFRAQAISLLALLGPAVQRNMQYFESQGVVR
jgi:hypothetical protein